MRPCLPAGAANQLCMPISEDRSWSASGANTYQSSNPGSNGIRLGPARNSTSSARSSTIDVFAGWPAASRPSASTTRAAPSLGMSLGARGQLRGPARRVKNAYLADRISQSLPIERKFNLPGLSPTEIGEGLAAIECLFGQGHRGDDV